jgi:hypothetical protein
MPQVPRLAASRFLTLERSPERNQAETRSGGNPCYRDRTVGPAGAANRAG